MILNELAIFLIAVVALYDIVLIMQYKPTISQAYQKLFPTWLDVIILIPVVVGICFLPISYVLRILLGVVAGHVFFPNKELWRK